MPAINGTVQLDQRARPRLVKLQPMFVKHAAIPAKGAAEEQITLFYLLKTWLDKLDKLDRH
jgi:hypothetical protein